MLFGFALLLFGVNAELDHVLRKPQVRYHADKDVVTGCMWVLRMDRNGKEVKDDCRNYKPATLEAMDHIRDYSHEAQAGEEDTFVQESIQKSRKR